MAKDAVNKKRNEKTYGDEVSAKGIVEWLEHLFSINQAEWKTQDEAIKRGEQRQIRLEVPCIWGRHGIGKTELVKAFAEEGHLVVPVSFAMFEEMGDLHGMPTIENGVTVNRPPEWVPTQEPPAGKMGILFADDFNRADDRILRGIMQLFQDSGLSSWKLPRGWMIVCSANPEGGEYSVTPLDEAMKTRLSHVTMKFNLSEWQQWALGKGNVDVRFVNFTTQYKELAEKGCPRTFVKCARQLANIENWKERLPLVITIINSNLEQEIAVEFLKYVSSGMIELISPEEIMSLSKEKMQEKFNKFLRDCVDSSSGNSKKVGPLNVIITRLQIKLQNMYAAKQSITKEEGINIARFLASPEIDNDLRRNACEMIQTVLPNVRESDRILNAKIDGQKYDTLMESLYSDLR